VTNEERNVAAVRRLNDLVNDEGYDEMDELFAADYRDHNPNWKITSVAELKTVIAGAHVNFGIHNEIEEVLAAGDKVFVRVNSRGRHLKPAFGVAPTGRDTQLLSFEIYRFDDDGRIAERWVLSDLVGLMRQLGAPVPGMEGSSPGRR
jgi:predicted SnoaL-like aldol condensation-catalyzing enzyme